MPKKSTNPFAALEEEDYEEKAKAIFAPSVLAGAGAANTAPTLPQPPAAAAQMSSTVDLKSALDDLSDSVPAQQSAAAWDFSSFNDASKAAQDEWAREQERKQKEQVEQKKLMEEHLARLHASDQEKLQEKAAMLSYSSKQNERRRERAERAEGQKEKLSGKAARKADARKRLNQAKNMY